MPCVLSTDHIPSVPKCNTGVPNVTTITNVPKMTKYDPSVPVFSSVHFYMGF